MRTFFIYDLFEIYSVASDCWEKGKHRHQFFEILYIEEGMGLHIVNGFHHTYRTGDIFMLTPGDSHSFSTASYTKFHCIRFLPELFTKENNESRKIFLQLEESISYHNQHSGKALEKSDEVQFAVVLIDQILKESSLRPRQHELIIKSYICLILQLLLRSAGRVTYDFRDQLANDLTIDNMLSYVRFNITDNLKLTKKNLACFFNISPHYVGEYFKKHCGVNLRDYIARCKLNHIERKMLNNNLSISQIAYELGFADESHLCKFIKRYTGQVPTAYRKNLK